MACTAKAWANPIVRKNFNFLENLTQHTYIVKYMNVEIKENLYLLFKVKLVLICNYCSNLKKLAPL